MNIGRINDSKSLSSYIETSAKPNLLIMAIIDYQQVACFLKPPVKGVF